MKMDKNKRKPPVRPDTLAALRKLENEEPLPPPAEDPRSATGFAAMLARGNNSPDVFSPLGSVLDADMKASRGNMPPPRPQPKPQPASRKDPLPEIPEAKVLEVRSPAYSVPAASPPAKQPVSPRTSDSKSYAWYRLAIPVLLVLGSVLILIGLWAIASLLGWPNALIPHNHDGRGYQAAMSLAREMLIALPVGALVDAMAVFMLYRLHGKK
jgi:hypothetical protein